MLYTRQAGGKTSEIVERLSKAIKDNHFGILGTIDLKAKMVEKGVPFDHDCVILEVCNPKQAKKVLDQNMAVSTALPCRISVYGDDGHMMGGGPLWSWIGLAAGVLGLIGAVMLYSKPASARAWGIAILVVSALGLVAGAGGLLAGILGIVSGLLAITWRPEAR